MKLSLLDNVQLPGTAAVNLLLAAGAVLLRPGLDSLLTSDSPEPLSGCIGDSKGLALLIPASNGYQHHDIVTPFVMTTKLIPSAMPLLQPSSTTVSVIFGMAACFLSLVAAGTFLVRTHVSSQSGGPSSPPPLRSLSETLAYNREQRQTQDGRDVPRRRSGRGPPDPIPPNNNYNNVPFEEIKLPRSKKHSQVRAGIGAPAPPPPPPPPPPIAVYADKAGRKAGANTLWKCLFGLSVMALFVKYTSTSSRSYSESDDISDNTSSMPLDFPGPTELQHSPVALPDSLGPLLIRLQVVHKAIYSFIPNGFTSPCLFLRLVMDYVLCTLLCWILSSICALASGSACTGVYQIEEDEIIQVEVGPSDKQDRPQLPCEDLGSPERVYDNAAINIAVEDIMVGPLPSEPDGNQEGPADSSTQPAERHVPPPGRTRRTRPRRHPNRPPRPSQNHASGTDQAIPV